MSLVEKTLRKLQQSAVQAAADTDTERSDNDAEITATAAPAGPPVTINLAAMRAAGLVPSEEDEQRLRTQYRHIKRPLIANAVGRGVPALPNGHLIVISSAMPGEGKTFTAVNLALNMSLEKDIHVVLVDADVARPQLSRVLGVSEEPGLLDAVRDEHLDAEQVVRPTDIPNLSLIAAGRQSPEATELLGSERMAQVATALAKHDRKRILVLDSPPLLLTNESQVLTRIAGQVVVVVRAEFTPQPVVLDALELVEGEAPVYLVLNQSLRPPTGAYYYYGYGDSYGDSGGKSASAKRQETKA